MVFAAPVGGAADIHTGWAAWFHSDRLNERWTWVSDVQLRSTDEWESVRTAIVRYGANRSWRDGMSVGLGLAHIVTVEPAGKDLTEHRIWQQWLLQQTVGSNPLTHRVRLEQRFIERAGREDVYSDRLRYFARLLVPFKASSGSAFSEGGYLALQNEVFLNLSSREKLNGKLLDQNRAYVAVGKRLSKALDLEIGYLRQDIQGRSVDTRNHAIQLAVYSRF